MSSLDMNKLKSSAFFDFLQSIQYKVSCNKVVEEQSLKEKQLQIWFMFSNGPSVKL